MIKEKVIAIYPDKSTFSESTFDFHSYSTYTVGSKMAVAHLKNMQSFARTIQTKDFGCMEDDV